LRFVKALGLLVEGQAQVSMNLTDFQRTPIHRVLEMVRVEAARYGLSVTRTEVVGLVPARALFDAADFYLQLYGFSLDQILENRLANDE
jgi:glutamate formiminotransferase/formiminotetrahydrofolate cyclodeaminase